MIFSCVKTSLVLPKSTITPFFNKHRKSEISFKILKSCEVTIVCIPWEFYFFIKDETL